jgi:hypothetical protein
LQSKVQPEFLGGVFARVGVLVIDGSIRHRLAVLKQQLLTGVAVGVNGSSGSEIANIPGGGASQPTSEPSSI